MHNLNTVVRFEIVRTLKKKSFWIAAFAVPLIVGLVGVIIYFSNKTTSDQAEKLATERFAIGITDKSGIISKETLAAIGAKTIGTKQEGEAAVKSGQLDGYFYYPKDISKDNVETYGQDVGLFRNNRYQDFARELLKQSAATQASPSIQTALQDKVKFNSVTFTSDGEIDQGFMKLIAPGIFLVLFYFMIATFGNQILTSITEEKENRVIEMILATIKPTTLLVGKLLSLVALALIQMVVILLPVILGYFLFRDQLSLPQFDLAAIPLDPVRITLGAVIFATSFFMFAGILMTLGAAMPTAKEAGSFFGAAMALVFGPLYAAPLFVTSPDSIVVQALSYFPLTAPIPLLLRNAVGNLTVGEALISLSLLAATTIVVISIGVRIFKFGALEYSRKLSLQEVIRRKN